MKTINRRRFFERAGLATTALLIPNFLKAFQHPGFLPGGNKVLVVIQLSGGNDGLNTVIPFNNDIYYQRRPSLSIAKENVLKLNDEMGFNPSLAKLQDLFHNGNLTILNNVGYPNPDRSHFRSMEIWQTASGSDQFLTSGWIGRYLDAQCPDCNNSYMAIEVDDTLSLTLKGNQKNGIAVSKPEVLYSATKDPFFQKIAGEEAHVKEDNLHYLYKTMAETMSSAKYIYDNSRVYTSSIEYPRSEFGQHLKRVAELIVSGLDTKVYYVSLGSFDTHSKQSGQQDRLLQQLGDGLEAFTRDMKQNNRFNDVLVFTFSEFGRRVAENASEGTDHGTANNIFIVGGNLNRPGILNETPDLNDLDEGDLKYRIDFRQLYATVLNKWLGVNDELILGNKFEYLNIV